MPEQTLQAPTIDVPASGSHLAAPARERFARLGLTGATPWILTAVTLLLVSLLLLLDAGTRPGYDPYGWLVWGKLTLHLKLDTNGAPSWKPLPFLFTVPYSLVGHYALWLWMVTSVAISLSGPIFAWRIAFRLTDAPPERRYASYAAGLFAAAFVFGLQDPITHPNSNYMHYVLSAESDTMIVALCLAAVDFHLAGKHRIAFWVWLLGGLGRPEVWPFLGLSGLWLWRYQPAYRRWVIAGFALIPVLWLGIPGISSKSFFTAANIAQNSPRELHGNKITGTISRFYHLQALQVWLAGIAMVGLAALRVRRSARPARSPDLRILVIAAGILLWLLVEIVFALRGLPAVPRYLFEPGSLVDVLAGVLVGRVILDVPGLISSSPFVSGRLATRLGNWGAVIVLALFAGSLLPVASRQARLERHDLTHERARTANINSLSTVVRVLGASHILACGQPNIPIGFQSVFAWYAGVKIGILYVSPGYLRAHPHPLVNIYPDGTGWKVWPSHVDPASVARCQGLTRTFRG